MTADESFDPYALLGALAGERVGFTVIGAFARVVHGSRETTDGLDIVPSMRDDNLRRLERAIDELDGRGPRRRRITASHLASGEPVTLRTRAGELRIIPTPWGTRGYDDLRIRAGRENLGRGARPSIASVADLRRMLEASQRIEDRARLGRLQRMMELETQLTRRRRLAPSRDLGL